MKIIQILFSAMIMARITTALKASSPQVNLAKTPPDLINSSDNTKTKSLSNRKLKYRLKMRDKSAETKKADSFFKGLGMGSITGGVVGTAGGALLGKISSTRDIRKLRSLRNTKNALSASTFALDMINQKLDESLKGLDENSVKGSISNPLDIMKETIKTLAGRLSSIKSKEKELRTI